jgi:hypothetical protein
MVKSCLRQWKDCLLWLGGIADAIRRQFRFFHPAGTGRQHETNPNESVDLFYASLPQYTIVILSFHDHPCYGKIGHVLKVSPKFAESQPGAVRTSSHDWDDATCHILWRSAINWFPTQIISKP